VSPARILEEKSGGTAVEFRRVLVVCVTARELSGVPGGHPYPCVTTWSRMRG
jgi:hypothetical protein